MNTAKIVSVAQHSTLRTLCCSSGALHCYFRNFHTYKKRFDSHYDHRSKDAVLITGQYMLFSVCHSVMCLASSVKNFHLFEGVEYEISLHHYQIISLLM
jgi:hypothetical protein